ncbi:MAG: MarR family transcriptional regulator [Arenicellales bacterium]
MADPTQNFGFLMYEVSRLLRRRLDRRLKPLGLTEAQWRALALLARREGVNQATLAEGLEVRPISVARLIDRLQAAGWVERRSDPDDRRACCLYLTKAAQPLLKQIRTQAQMVREEALDGLPRETREVLVDALCSIKQNLSREAPCREANGNDD